MKKAVIIGSAGQDGRLLTDYLRERGYAILGLDRQKTSSDGIGWDPAVDITNYSDVEAFVRDIRPDEIYHLAAVHHASTERLEEDIKLVRLMREVNYESLLNVLQSVKEHSPATRVFFAASSHVFGSPEERVQDESTPLSPDSIYGLTKANGLLACRMYRQAHGISASCGILYTHESEFREEKFLSMKIIRAALRIRTGEQKELVLGDLNSEIDWGYAKDYVRAMHEIINASMADDFIVATGVAHTVRDFVAGVFGELDLDWKKSVITDPSIVARRTPVRIGNSSKLRSLTGWAPKTDFDEMIRSILRSAR